MAKRYILQQHFNRKLAGRNTTIKPLHRPWAPQCIALQMDRQTDRRHYDTKSRCILHAVRSPKRHEVGHYRRFACEIFRGLKKLGPTKRFLDGEDKMTILCIKIYKLSTRIVEIIWKYNKPPAFQTWTTFYDENDESDTLTFTGDWFKRPGSIIGAVDKQWAHFVDLVAGITRDVYLGTIRVLGTA